MDVDEPQPTRNSPFIHYFDMSDGFPWQEPRPEQIRLRRASLDDTLIFDILLSSGGIGDTYVLYPPESPEILEQLLDAIECSNYDLLKKDCLVYFLLKWHQDGRERAFQEQRCIPPQFVALADAYWHLDTGINVPRAVALLSDARLNRDYASKIIHAISLSPEAAPLIRRYVQTAKPPLVEPLDIEYYALALADLSVLDAWSFARTFNETDSSRTRLLRKIFEWIISPQPRPIALKQLVTVPLSPFEENVLGEFVQKPPNAIPFSCIAILQDLICVRLIQGGRYSEAIELDRLFTSTTHQKHLKDTHDRSTMVQDVYHALPAVEKALLDLELDPDPLHQQRSILSRPVSSPENSRKAAAGEGQTSSLSQSWEEVRVPESLVPKSTPLRDVQLPRLAGAPATALPVRLHGTTSGTTPRKNLPGVASVPLSARPAPHQPLTLSGVGSRMLFGTPNAIASPASGIKLPPGPNFGSSHGLSPSFVSASRQRNAFYQPPVKSNGVKRAFEDESRRSPELDDNRVSSDGESPQADVGMEPEGGDKGYEEETISRHVRGPSVEESDEEESALQYSVFGAKNELKRNVEASKNELGGHGHGSYRTGDEDGMEIYERPEREQKKPSKTRRSTRATQPKAAATTSLSKPPAKKAKQIKEVVRHIPGGLMEETDDDEEEDEDQVMALPTNTRNPRNPSRASAVKGKRKAVSVDNLVDEMDVGVQTRRRSSRLTAASSSGSIRTGGSPEPLVAAPKTRRAAGRISTASKKKR